MMMLNDTEISYIILTYWLISGIICAIYFLEVLQYKDEWQDKVRDYVWNTGLDDSFWQWVGFTMCLLLGFYLLPKKIITKVLKLLGIVEEEKK